MKKKKILTLFSGGLDSTYLIYKSLKDGHYVVPIYIELTNNKNKTIVEKDRINKLYNLFIKDFNYNIDSIRTPLQLNINSWRNELMFSQMPLWVFGILYSGELSNIDEIHIGYVMNDDAISYLDDLKKIYKSFQIISHTKLPKLIFPLIKTPKEQILNELPYNYQKLTISCEDPKLALGSDGVEFFNCGYCAACKRRGFTNKKDNKDNMDYLIAKVKDVETNEGLLTPTSSFQDVNVGF